MSIEEGVVPAQAPGPGPISQPVAGPPVAISVRNVNKRFEIPDEKANTLKQRIIQPNRGRVTVLEALKDIDFDIRVGEFFGIVGRNGSGKSTMLKCMGGIYTPDSGEIATRGQVATFIELGVGFNPELSARDNVELNASLLGLSAHEVNERFDDIIAFAELEDYVDLKLKNYSSGMHVRLAFSVATHVDADILLIDEVLAVGDAAFQQKCFDTFERFRREGRTVVFVTHDMALVERFCTRALMLEHGEIVSFGNPSDVGIEYMRANFNQMTDEVAEQAAEIERYGDGAAEIISSQFLNTEGHGMTRFKQGDETVLKMRVRFEKAMQNPIFAVSVRDHDKRTIFFASTLLDGIRTGHFEPGDEVTYTVQFTNLLEDGRYLVSPSVIHDGNIHVADLHQDRGSFLVTGRQSASGRVNLKHTIEVQR
ncbi:MAG: ABC transporter ATP-binding protein [Solirubrobacterales bacterium]